MKIKKAGLSILLISLLAASGSTTGYLWHRSQQQQKARALKWEQWLSLKPELERIILEFKGSAGIVVKDLETGWEFTLNKANKYPGASLLKLPLMLAVYDAAHRGAFSLDDKMVLKGADKVNGSGELKCLPSGCTFTVDELIELMISASDNTATNMLIRRLQFREINRWFRDFGLQDTNLGRYMMDFRYRGKGVENYTSPRDVALVLERLYRGRFINEEFSGKCLTHLKKQKVNNRIPALLPSETPVAHKTGLERGVCHDAGIVYTPRGDFLLCVLTQDAPSHKNAKKFIAQVASAVYAYFREKD